jgi:hypothetical protein
MFHCIEASKSLCFMELEEAAAEQVTNNLRSSRKFYIRNPLQARFTLLPLASGLRRPPVRSHLCGLPSLRPISQGGRRRFGADNIKKGEARIYELVVGA